MVRPDRGCRMGTHLLVVIALGIPGLTAGCGRQGGDSPAPVNAAQEQKVQKYMSGYRDQIIESNKAKAKAKATGKESPGTAASP